MNMGYDEWTPDYLVMVVSIQAFVEPLKVGYQGGGIKPLKCSIDHPILLVPGLPICR